MNFEYKQVIVVRKDLELGKGKLAVQVAHASIGAYKKADKEIASEWGAEGGKKVVVEVQTEEDLLDLFESAKELGLPASLIKDAGLTEIPPGTVTTLGIGPERTEKVDKLTGNLPLLS